MQVVISVADHGHEKYAEAVCSMIEEAAQIRGTGISMRKPEYIRHKINEGKSVIALDGSTAVGFCYIESWDVQTFVANSGLIVHSDYRNTGLAKKIKIAIFELSEKKFPDSKMFGITTSLAVMKINSELGYKPVTFSELTSDENFWKGCESCANYDILLRTQRKMCLCTGMVYDRKNVFKPNGGKKKPSQSWEQFKKFLHQEKNIFRLKENLYPKISKILRK